MSPTPSLSQRVRVCAERIVESRAPALAGLYDLTSVRLVRYATAICRSRHDGEDAVQAALLQVAAHPEKLASAAQPWPYLLRMVRNEALMLMRRRKRWSFLEGISDLLAGRTVDTIERQETHRAVWSALSRLPTEQSEVVVLKIWEEFTFAEIGELLGVPAATVASRYRYAMEKLAHRLQPVHQEATDGG